MWWLWACSAELVSAVLPSSLTQSGDQLNPRRGSSLGTHPLFKCQRCSWCKPPSLGLCQLQRNAAADMLASPDVHVHVHVLASSGRPVPALLFQ